MKVKVEKNGKIEFIAENKKDSDDLLELTRKLSKKMEEMEVKNER